ncbi:ATP-binding cassette domain-containing protein [Nocardioides cheoyonin]|uniref:ATP-binding cassette domain-containing protein n=1 Tax=Nocardioides cheoyonin TaxID=3156615 RepID=UPI0032B359EA
MALFDAWEAPRRIMSRWGRSAPTAVRMPRQRFAYGRTLTIGRSPENDLVVSDHRADHHHARFVSLPDGRYRLRDLGSDHGTYVNGVQIPGRTAVELRHEDRIAIGRTTFRISGNTLEPCTETADIALWARRLTVTAGGRTILRDVSFRAPERSLIAVIGPSGSGKTTLLKAVTGYRPADEGEVLYAERDLYREYAELRDRIGLVPQDDILHAELTVRKALGYAAELRFPHDTAVDVRQERIDEVLRELRLHAHQDKRISSLSGGQRKRTSVALELLTKPSLLLLDEPTSGLDPGMDRDVMQLLRGLADGGRTVLVVTHSVAELALCDQVLVMAPGGTLAYAGPPHEALPYFGHSSWADVFADFENDADADWRERWLGSAPFERYAADAESEPAARTSARVRPTALPPRTQPWGTQFSTLVRRYLAVIRADPGFMALLVVLPVVLGLSTVTIKPSKDLTSLGYDATGMLIPNIVTSTVLMVIAVGICFTGAANAVRELIKERVIYERERAVGLSRSAYVWSKVVVLGAITALQAVAMTAIATSIHGVPGRGLVLGPFVRLELAVPMILLGVTAMLVGLAISALVRTSERTMPLLVMFAVLQISFGGCLYSLLGSPGNWFSWVMPARWGVAAMGDTLDLNEQFRDRDFPHRIDWLWQHAPDHWAFAVGALLLLSTLLLVAVFRLLRRHEPEVMRR